MKMTMLPAILVLSLSILSGNLTKDLRKDTEGSLEVSSESNFPEEFATESSETGTVVNGTENVTKEFRPSVHLGEIVEPARNPFNNVQSIKFENHVDPDFQGLLRGRQKPSGRIRFQDDVNEGTEVPGVRYRPMEAFKQQEPRVPFMPKVHFEKPDKTDQVIEDHTVFQNFEKPLYNLQESVLESPTKYGEIPPEYSGVNFDVGYPSVYNYYNGNYDYQPVTTGYHESPLEIPEKPENGVLYLQQSLFTRTRKFPYQYYHLPIGYHELGYPEGYARKRRLSPWKKLVHLIGTFLPLGLLLASLTPNVVRIDNTTQPNIVLSKLRVADLPAEHKQARIRDSESEVCQDRSICEMILAGGQPGSNVLQNILWNFARRNSEKAAKENGLREIFEAVRANNCTTLDC